MDVSALIRNEVKVTKRLTPTHREIVFRTGKRHLDLGLAAYVRAICPRYPDGLVERWCADGRVLLDGRAAAADAALLPGQLVELRAELPVAQDDYVPPPLVFVHADADVAVANKDVGHLAHPAGQIMTHTLLHQVQAWAQPRGVAAEDVRLVNRIDRDTSGLVICSLNLPAHVVLARAIAERRAHKEYLAICHGAPPEDAGDWRDPIGTPDAGPEQIRCVRADGQDAHTQWRVEARAPGNAFALLRLILHTGRQHQIRVHAAHHGHPLVGDWVYGTRCAELPGQALHAARLVIDHPRGGSLDLAAPLTERLRALWERLAAGGAPTPQELSPEQRSKLGLG
jgi:23S rRNA pseudouridine1911/1915/1917 synthase